MVLELVLSICVPYSCAVIQQENQAPCTFIDHLSIIDYETM